jgi:paraquat-inducible protein A
MSALALIACHECDVLQRRVALPPGGAARCRRCGALLYKRARGGLDESVAWAIAAAALLVIANAFPIVSLEVQGLETQATLLGAARALHDQGMTAVAALVLATLVVAPVLGLGALLYLLTPLHFGRVAPGFAPLFRLMQAAGPWQMFEVFMLGILVSVVKLSHLASVVPGIGLWAFLALMFASVAATSSYDPQSVWARAEASNARPLAPRTVGDIAG